MLWNNSISEIVRKFEKTAYRRKNISGEITK